MLIAAIVGLDTRTTMDLDTTLRSIPLTEEKSMRHSLIYVKYEFSGIFDEDLRISLWGCNIKTVIAEKMETISIKKS